MYLRDGVLDCRLKLAELRARFWSDTEIAIELNTSAQILCSEAQNLTGFHHFQTRQIGGDGVNADTWAQEYTVPLNIDTITAASYLSGTMFKLTPADASDLQLGSYVGGIPFYIYMKPQTNVLTPQVQSGGVISQPLPGGPGQPDFQTVIGLWPVPQQAIDVYLWTLMWHPQMTASTDPVQIPPRFRLAWTSYATARLYEKAQKYDKAQYWDGIHEREKQKFIDYMIDQRQEMLPPQYTNQPAVGNFLRGANTVLVVANNPTMSNM